MLDGSNSGVFRSRGGTPKRAVLNWPAAEYVLAWGTQRFDRPHVRVLDPQGDYGVELEVFFRTHRALPELADCYVKTVEVRAALVAAPFTLVTLVKGAVEMVADVPAGAVVVQNPDGEVYAMGADQFAQRYEAVGGAGILLSP